MIKTISFNLYFFVFSLMYVKGQSQIGKTVNFSSFFIENTLQSKQKVNNTAATCQIPNLGLGMNIPLYKNNQLSNDTVYPQRFGINLVPSIKWTKLKLSYLPENRTLINAKLALNTYYLFKQKNALNLNVAGLLYEDEFTIGKPSLKYNFTFLYSRRVSKQFTYYGGLVYSFVYGEGILLPALGFRYTIGQKSQLSLILPFQLTYRTHLSSNIKLIVYAHPQGGINRFHNDSTLTGNASDIVMFRRRSYAIGGIFIFKLKNNLNLLVDPSVLLAQHIYFSEDNERKGTQYSNNAISNGFQIRTRLIWRFNAKKPKPQNIDDLLNEDIYLLDL